MVFSSIEHGIAHYSLLIELDEYVQIADSMLRKGGV